MHNRHTVALVASLATLVGAPDAFAGANPNFTLPLHAKVSQFEPCDGYLPVDCLGIRPTVQVESGQPVAVFLLVANYTQLAGLQTAFEVDPRWSYLFGLWFCTPSYSDLHPVPPFGPTAGTVTCGFINCVTSGELLPIGRMHFISGTGCVGQIESSFPMGTWAMDCQEQIDQVFVNDPGQTARLGRVCVGPGGHDACEAATPVAAATWGRIKATYPQRDGP
jgi:hypothetical protein